MPISMILGKQIKFSSTLAKKEKVKVLKKKKNYMVSPKTYKLTLYWA